MTDPLTADLLRRLLDDFACVVNVRWAEDRMERAPEFVVRVDERRGDGDASGAQYTEVRARVDVQRVRSSGAMVDMVAHMIESATTSALRTHILNRLLQGLDFALFALDHADAHGPRVVGSGVRELWAQSKDVWPAYADRRDKIISWMLEK